MVDQYTIYNEYWTIMCQFYWKLTAFSLGTLRKCTGFLSSMRNFKPSKYKNSLDIPIKKFTIFPRNPMKILKDTTLIFLTNGNDRVKRIVLDEN